MLFQECPTCGSLTRADINVCTFCGESMTGEPVNPDDYPDALEFDYAIEQIGSWSTVKHEVVEKYAGAYTTILARQRNIRERIYIDAFAGTGYAENRHSGDLLYGSAARAVEITPPFTQIHLIEKNLDRVGSLRRHFGHDDRVEVHPGDAVSVLSEVVLPRCQYSDYARALCLLDPYGLTVPWTLIAQIGSMKSVEIFFNFMVVSANRNVLWSDPSRVSEKRKKRLDFVWGDRSWEDLVYKTIGQDLFGADVKVKGSNEVIINGFRERLKTKGGFAYVPAPIPITNSLGATIYYLFFASPNKTANKIVTQIFDSYRR